jgi:hypothetical protein
LRLLGLSFEHTVLLLVVLNMPVIILIWKKKENIPLSTHSTMIRWAPAILVPVLCLAAILLVWPHWRLLHGHPWMYTDEVYTIANGELVPEDPYLAGVTLSYPWPAHVYQAVLSYLIDSPPLMSFLWISILWVVFIAHLTASLVKRLGGNHNSAVFSVIGLFFGVNFVGYFSEQILPSRVVSSLRIWGDYRYTPWLWKFFSFNQEPFALAFFTGILFLMADQWPGEFKWSGATVLFLLLTGLGLFFPQLLPIGCAVALGGLISTFMKDIRISRLLAYNRLFVIGFSILLASIISAAHLRLVTHDSMKLATLGISDVGNMIRKSLATLVVTFPLLCGLGLAFSDLWKRRRNVVLVLLSGALASCALHVVLHIPYFENEYKFILTAAICLAPFFGLAFEPLLIRLRSWALPFTAMLTLVMAGPFFHKLYTGKPNYKIGLQAIPLVDTRDFSLRLDQREKLARLTDVIREKTPKETLLVTDHVDLDLTAVTRRKLFIPPDLGFAPPGVSLRYVTVLENVRGYDQKIVEDRLATLRALFDQGHPDLFEGALQKMLRLGRPIGIILDEIRHKELLSRLEKGNIGVRLYAGEGVVFRLVTPPKAK